MRLYLFYVFGSVLNFYQILLYFGVSAGFANYAPVVALLGSATLFAVAAPVLMYRVRAGLVIGLIGCLLVVPYDALFITSVFQENYSLWPGLLVSIPTMLIMLGTYFTIRALLKSSVPVPSKPVIKLILSIIPVALFILYVAVYGKYWI